MDLGVLLVIGLAGVRHLFGVLIVNFTELSKFSISKFVSSKSAKIESGAGTMSFILGYFFLMFYH